MQDIKRYNERYLKIKFKYSEDFSLYPYITMSKQTQSAYHNGSVPLVMALVESSSRRSVRSSIGVVLILCAALLSSCLEGMHPYSYLCTVIITMIFVSCMLNLVMSMGMQRKIYVTLRMTATSKRGR
jgi:uncharacterized membrane protein